MPVQVCIQIYHVNLMAKEAVSAIIISGFGCS